MSEILPTKVIKTENGPVVINAADFDPEMHEEFVDAQSVDVAPKRKKKSSELTIVEKDGKFLIENGKGENVGSSEFDTKEEAEQMLSLLVVK